MKRWKQYKFGTQDIADATGKSVDAVKKDRERNVFNPYCLVSLAHYVDSNARNAVPISTQGYEKPNGFDPYTLATVVETPDEKAARRKAEAYARNKRWREKNWDHYRATQRVRVARWRAKKKAALAASKATAPRNHGTYLTGETWSIGACEPGKESI